MMIDADVIDGARLESLIEHLLANKSTDSLHIHNAKLGCYAALVERGYQLPKDFAPPVDYRWPEYVTTARGEEWWIPEGA